MQREFDFEAAALKRDRSFLWKLGGALLLGVIAAGLIFGKLTDTRTTGCLANSLGNASGIAGPGPDAAAP